MGRPFIVLDDKASNQGQVIEASQVSTAGKRIARVGDRVSCHPDCRIATGDPHTLIDGRAVARHGDTTTCGATLIASQIASATGA
jgi:uncharacterized Zn-binding protein involved in type VI secretion